MSSISFPFETAQEIYSLGSYFTSNISQILFTSPIKYIPQKATCGCSSSKYSKVGGSEGTSLRTVLQNEQNEQNQLCRSSWKGVKGL